MQTTIKLSELATLGASAQEEKLGELVRATRRPANGEVTELEARLLAYETAHGFASTALVERLRAGAVKETPDVCAWLMLVSLRDRIVSVEARSR